MVLGVDQRVDMNDEAAAKVDEYKIEVLLS
jgi:hypothetical protein